MNMIKIQRGQFLKALEIGGASAGQNKAMPIYDYVKCSVQDNNMVISSCNGNTAVYRDVEVESDDNISFCVAPDGLNKFLASVREPELFLEVGAESLSIKHNRGSIQLPIMNGDEFIEPNWEMDSTTTIQIPTGTLSRWLDISKDFVSQDSLRPVMMGMYVGVNGDEMTICATDAHKLFTDKIAVYDKGEFETVIPATSFNAIKRVIGNTENVRVTFSSIVCVFSTDDAKVLCRVLEGKYPNFKSIIPKTLSISVDASVNEIKTAISRAVISAEKISHKTKLTFDSDSLGIECQDEELSKKSIEYLPITKEGADIVIGVNAKIFNSSLNVISSDEIEIFMNDSSKAIIVKDKIHTNSLFLIMPILL